VVVPLGGRELIAEGVRCSKAVISVPAVRHYLARRAVPPDASEAMFRGLSGAGFQLPRLSGGPTRPRTHPHL